MMPRRLTTTFDLALLVVVALLAVIALLGALAPATAGERRIVPAVTIYPGDVIREDMLSDADFPNAVESSSYVMSRFAVVGKVARRTLLPGQPIAATSVGEPRLVRVGAMVRLVYQEDGLTIQTYASALQNGAAGDVVAVRNTESGVTLSGVVAPDGSIHVGGG